MTFRLFGKVTSDVVPVRTRLPSDGFFDSELLASAGDHPHVGLTVLAR
jgi:hypothetical protein